MIEIVIDPIHSTIDGGIHAPPDTRVHVHAQLTVLGLRDVGLSAAPAKVVVGDPIISLGLRVSRAERQINCPALKRASIIDSTARQRRSAIDDHTVDRDLAETLVGRAVNLSQIFPELNGVLHGGYAVTQASWEAGGRRRRPTALHLRDGSSAHAAWVGCLDVLSDLVVANDGIDIAPERSFPSRSDPGSLTVTTDASGVDGVGGYAFHTSHPHDVWVVAEQWPADIQRALDAAAAGDSSQPALSMPAAELFGSVAIAATVADAVGSAPSAVYAVTDCDPAARVINAATSGAPQLRRILGIGRGLCDLWLAVHCRRESNVDADRLSHPRQYDAVAADAAAAGLTVHRVRLPPQHWERLREAAQVGVGRGRGGA